MGLKPIGLAAALAAGMLAGAILTGGALAKGYGTAGCVTANLRFVVDGISQQPHAPGGDPPALICGGTSYVPTRFLAAALGRTVAWDGTTRTVTIGSPKTGSGPTCVLVVDLNGPGGTVGGTVSASYGETSRRLSQATQSLDLPCGTSVVLTEQPASPSLAPFQNWSVQTADGDTTSTASTLEIRLIGDTTTVAATYAGAAGGTGGQ